MAPSVAPSGHLTETAQPVISTPFSLQGYTPSYSLQSSVSGPVRKADPRPLRDKNYQSLILKEIYDFCIGNRFELEMSHPIAPKTLRQPTQKDFVLLFQFLYGKIDPNHKFTRSVESEVFIILKSLGYPYLDGINRSSISAVGGQNWPAFLGMLYWLVKINLTMLDLEDDQLIAPDDIFDKIFIKYILSSYTAFIEQKEDYSDHYEAMKAEYDAANESLSVQADEKRQTNRELSEKFKEISAQFKEVEEAREKSKALENDLKQFSEYMRKVKERQAQWKDILDQVESDIASAALRLDELDAQRKALEDSIHQKGSSINEIDNLNLERDKISRFLDTVSNRIEDVKVILSQKEMDIHQSLQSLQNFVNQYNSMTSKIPSKESDGFELVIEPLLVGGGGEGLTVGPEAVLNKLLRTEKIKLLETREKLKQELRRVEDETIKVSDLVDQVSEHIFYQKEQAQEASEDLKKSKDMETEIFDVMTRENLVRNGQCEKLEHELQEIRIQTNSGVVEANSQNEDLQRELTESKFKIQHEREQLHETVVKMLQDVVKFKLNIQEILEGLEASTLEELEELDKNNLEELEAELQKYSGGS